MNDKFDRKGFWTVIAIDIICIMFFNWLITNCI